MKKINILYTIALGAASILGSSCEDFLNTMPDNRAEVDSQAKITSLLVSAYPLANPIQIFELSSDNTMDSGPQYDPYWDSIEKAYRWEDITEIDDDDPKGIWDRCYVAIASANQALEAIDKLGNPDNLAPQKGEALICRAYGHFILANTFCLAYNPNTAQSDMGLPYSDTPETKPVVKYERGTLGDMYAKIAEDIEAGLPLINDDIYSVPKYHFNRKAAYAFATRFYLFYTQPDKSNYKKAIEYANVALGSGDPSKSLRNWAAINSAPTDLEVKGNMYIDASESSNFLLTPIYSVWGYAHGPYAGRNNRYGNASAIFGVEGPRAAGPWGNQYNLRVTNGNVFGLTQKLYIPKMLAYFEYTDKAASIGFLHLVLPAFTADETLLCRAEAYILNDQFDEGTTDINYWLKSHSVNYKPMTKEQIVEFYSKIKYMPTSVTNNNERTVKKRLNPAGIVVADGMQEGLIQCILQMRRVETVHEGLRWLDIKRYGIEIAHNRVGESDDILTKDDPRRAIQLPQDVINAGLAANPR